MLIFSLLERFQGVVAICLLLSTSLAWGESPIENLTLVAGTSVKDSDVNYSCVNESGLARADVSVNFDSQWVDINVGVDRGRFSGVATKASFTEGGKSFRALHLSNNGRPYFYDFSLVTDMSQKKTFLTFKYGAGELRCTD